MATRKFQEEEQSAPKLSVKTVEISPAEAQKLRAWCDRQLWDFFTVQYADFACRNDARKVVLTVYPPKKPGKPAKLVVSGKGTEEFIQFVLEPEITGTAQLGYDEVLHPEWYELHAGMDESGKGDLFGPVVTAVVIADGEAARAWVKAGVKDSKALNDKTVLKLDKLIQETEGVAVKKAWMGMEKYNQLMAKPRANLNLLLAWLHSRSLQAALAVKDAPWGMLDQFSKQPLVQRQLKKDGVTFDLRMQTKAEADPIVAAASICARAEFVRHLHSLSKIAGEELRFGAGADVKQQGLRLVAKHGPDLLPQIAKMHFRTAYQILGLPVPEKKEWKPHHIS